MELITTLDVILAFGFAICLVAAIVLPSLRRVAHAGMWMFGVAVGISLGVAVTTTSSTFDGSSGAVAGAVVFTLLSAAGGAIAAGMFVSLTRD